MSAGTVVGERRRPLGAAAAPHVESLLGSPALMAVFGLTVLGGVLRFVQIGHQGYWFDEANTALLVHFSPGKMLGLIPQTESTPPLYYCVAWVWAHIFGYGEAGLRSLSALAGTLTVPVAYGAGRKLISRRAGLIAAALAACNPLLIWYSQEARSYSLLVLLTGAALLAFAHAREHPTHRILAAWVLASAGALATHYYAILAIAPQAVWLLVVHRRRRSVQLAVGVVGLCGLALIPLAIGQTGTGRATWIATVALGRRLGQVVPQFVVSFDGPAHAVLEPLAAAILASSLVFLLSHPAGAERRGALLAGALALVGLALNLAMVGVGIDDLLTRNVLALWMPAALVVAGGFALSRPRAIGVAATTALCAIGVLTAVGVAVDRNLQRPDWRVVANVLGQRPAASTPAAHGRVILVQHYRDLLPLSLYLRGVRGLPRRGAMVSELDVVSFSSPPSAGFCWWGSACNLWPSVMQPSYAISGFHELWRRHALQFTVLRMVSATPTHLTRRAVRRALQTTQLRDDELLYQR